MQHSVNINGKIVPAEQAMVPADNGAFRYGYGLFETMLVKRGVIRLGGYHWERLFAGMKALSFVVPGGWDARFFENEVERVVSRNNLQELCRVRLQVFAGGGGLFGAESNRPGFVIECFSLEPETLNMNENGLHVGCSSGLRKSVDQLSNLKTCNALIYAIAARQARDHKWNDALIINTNGHIIESTIANLFWIRDGVVFTPPLSEGCVAGVMRRHLLEKMTVREAMLTEAVLAEAEEVFLTNAIKAIRWVSSFGEACYTNRVIAAIQNDLIP